MYAREIRTTKNQINYKCCSTCSSLSTARHTRRRQPRASAACLALLYKSASAPSDPPYHPLFRSSPFSSCQTKVTTATNSSNITLLRAHHRVDTTPNNLNRPTRPATVVSLAINHSHSLKRSTFSSPRNRKAATVAWHAWRVCVCVVVRKSSARRVYSDQSERVALLGSCS